MQKYFTCSNHHSPQKKNDWPQNYSCRTTTLQAPTHSQSHIFRHNKNKGSHNRWCGPHGALISTSWSQRGITRRDNQKQPDSNKPTEGQWQLLLTVWAKVHQCCFDSKSMAGNKARFDSLFYQLNRWRKRIQYPWKKISSPSAPPTFKSCLHTTTHQAPTDHTTWSLRVCVCPMQCNVSIQQWQTQQHQRWQCEACTVISESSRSTRRSLTCLEKCWALSSSPDNSLPVISADNVPLSGQLGLQQLGCTAPPECRARLADLIHGFTSSEGESQPWTARAPSTELELRLIHRVNVTLSLSGVRLHTTHRPSPRWSHTGWTLGLVC